MKLILGLARYVPWEVLQELSTIELEAYTVILGEVETGKVWDFAKRDYVEDPRKARRGD